MKQKNKYLLWMLLAFCTLGLYAPVYAQDDLYYDPATDAPAQTATTNTTYSDDSEYREPSNITRRYDNDDYYDEDDDYAYQYSSRIRRFHQPAGVVDYYDPFFTDLYYYDPYFLPGNSIYTYGYNDYWSWRRWNRAQRWNNGFSWGFGPTWSSWGWSSCYSGYNSWNNPWAFNNYYYDPYWTYNGYNPYYRNTWVDNNYYYSNSGGNNNNGYQPKTYTGVRRHGSTVNPGYARIADNNGGLGRLAVQKTDGPVLEPRSRTRGDVVTKNVEPARTTTNPTDRTRTSEEYSRRPSDKANTPSGNGRDMDQPERTSPARETAPRRSEPAETRPSRTAEPSTRPSRTEPPTRSSAPETRPSRTEERPRTYERPAATEERTRSSSDRPARTEERSRTYDTPSRTQESRPSRSESRTFDSGSSSRSSSGSSGSSSGSSGSSSRSSSGSSSGGGRGRNN